MTRAVRGSTRFRRDVKRMRKRGKDISKLESIIAMLANDEKLLPRHRPHPLVGNWKPSWELHIEPDWLLVYQLTDEMLELVATGTHADLF